MFFTKCFYFGKHSAFFMRVPFLPISGAENFLIESPYNLAPFHDLIVFNSDSTI